MFNDVLMSRWLGTNILRLIWVEMRKENIIEIKDVVAMIYKCVWVYRWWVQWVIVKHDVEAFIWEVKKNKYFIWAIMLFWMHVIWANGVWIFEYKEHLTWKLWV